MTGTILFTLLELRYFLFLTPSHTLDPQDMSCIQCREINPDMRNLKASIANHPTSNISILALGKSNRGFKKNTDNNKSICEFNDHLNTSIRIEKEQRYYISHFIANIKIVETNQVTLVLQSISTLRKKCCQALTNLTHFHLIRFVLTLLTTVNIIIIGLRIVNQL